MSLKVIGTKRHEQNRDSTKPERKDLMKNILIWGVPRSGKSTLAYMIRQEFGHSVIQLDAIKSVYDVIRPEDKISARETTNLDESRMMAKMVTRLIQCLSWGNARVELQYSLRH